MNPRDSWSIKVLDAWVDHQPFSDARNIEQSKLDHGHYEVILRNEDTARNDYVGNTLPAARFSAAQEAWLHLPESARQEIGECPQ